MAVQLFRQQFLDLGRGGDFLSGGSGSARVDDPGPYQWIGEGLIQDVQYWLDSNGDGLRLPQSVRDLQLTFHQGHSLYNVYGGHEHWYRSAADQSWYFLTESGALTRWGGQNLQLTGTVVETVDTRHYYNPPSLIAASPAVEPWLNDVTYQLIDEHGNVVATTVSADLDLNNDGVIDPESERGWYRFDVDIPGLYTVRSVPPAGFRESATLHSQNAADIYQLKTSLGLHFLNSYYENVGFRGERWLKADQGWVFITPAGHLYRWSGRSGTAANPVSGTLLAQLGQAYYRNPGLIISAVDPQLQIQDQPVVAGASFGFHQPVQISGRTWNDINVDGIRNPEAYASAQQISRPVGAPAGNFLWFQVTDDQAVPGQNSVMYYYVAGIQLYRWNPESGSAYVTEIWGGAATSAGSVLHAVFTVEPWMNGRALELRDARGYLIATTVSADADLNGNGLIDPEVETGWYSFSDLLPGTSDGSWAVRTNGFSWFPTERFSAGTWPAGAFTD